jgi:hypothetical protein
MHSGQRGGCERYQVRFDVFKSASVSARVVDAALEFVVALAKSGQYCPPKALIDPKSVAEPLQEP